MRVPVIRLKKTLEVTLKDIFKRLNVLEGQDKKALKDEYREWFHAGEALKDHPHVLYANQINIEQL